MNKRGKKTTQQGKKAKADKKGREATTISLSPLSLEEALEELLKAKPPTKTREQKKGAGH